MKATVRRVLLIGLFLAGCSSAHARQGPQEIDALLRRAKKAHALQATDGIRLARRAYVEAERRQSPVHVLKSLNLLADFYESAHDYANARASLNAALQVKATPATDSLLGDTWVLYGVVSSNDHQDDAAIRQYKNAIPYYKRAGLPARLGMTYRNLGYSEKQRSRFAPANAYYFKAASIFSNSGDSTNLARCYNSIGLGFISLGNIPKAVAYQHKALDIRLRLADSSAIAQSYNNLGYAQLLHHQTDSALYFLEKALPLLETLGDDGLLALNLQNLGTAWQQKGQRERALAFLQRAMNIAEQEHLDEARVRGYLDLANLYRSGHEFQKALQAVNKSEQAAIQLAIPELVLQSIQLKAAIFTELKNYKSALLYTQKARALNDSLFNIEKSKAISELDVQYQTKEKDRSLQNYRIQSRLQEKVLTQQRYLIFSLIAGSALLATLLWFAIRSFLRKKKDHQHIRVLMKELNHRIVNNLQIISGLFTLQLAQPLEEEVRKSIRENATRINALNMIHQKLYHDEGAGLINMADYLQKLVNHIQESFRNPMQDIRLVVSSEAISLKPDMAVSIGLIVNELVTNAFKYAFSENGGDINVELRQKDLKTLSLAVHDNGRGMDERTFRANSFGLKLVEIMSKQLRATKITENASGTHYRFEMPMPH